MVLGYIINITDLYRLDTKGATDITKQNMRHYDKKLTPLERKSFILRALALLKSKQGLQHP